MYNIYLAILLSKEYYDKYYKYISIPKDQQEMNKVLGTIITLHKITEGDLTVDEVELNFYSTTEIKDKDKSTYEGIFNAIRNTSVSKEVIASSLAGIKERAVAGELAIAAFGVAEGQRPKSDLDLLYKELSNTQVAGVNQSISYRKTMISIVNRECISLVSSNYSIRKGIIMRISAYKNSISSRTIRANSYLISDKTVIAVRR